jgi:hypothetical protein
MSQVTNLNVSPYFDDFNSLGSKTKDYYQVLFKPGYPVQARELTTLQSILQSQIEKFGQHFFKEGAKVIPGNTGYNSFYYCVQLQNNYLGVPVESYANFLIGKKITGSTSGVSAIVDRVLLPQNSEKGNLTLYIQYVDTSSEDNATNTFSDGELLFCNEDIKTDVLATIVIPSNEPFAFTLEQNSSEIGSSFSIGDGIYFIRGRFVTVNKEEILLDQYSNRPSYRVGLNIREELINSYIDESLNDNSQGFNNYSAPGADRLKISVSLNKKSLDDFVDNNFVELATIQEGILRSKKLNTEYSLIADEFARRTFSESGDYTVNPFDISVRESLNDGIGNGGIFSSNNLTYSGSVPSNNLALYQISPGKAFVRGYEVETISTNFLDVQKPRTTRTLENQSIIFNTGSTFKLNRVYGSPVIGVGNTYVLSLRDERIGISSFSASGKEIGVARVYDFKLESGSYDTNRPNLNRWNISLYDIQTITEITLNEPITVSVPAFIKGKRSGATAFLKESVNGSTLLTLYQKNGQFVKNESFIINGVENSRVSIAATSYGISDIKSVYGQVGTANTFTADIIQSNLLSIGNAVITANHSGISTITTTSINFPNNQLKINDLVQFSSPNFTDSVVSKIVEITSDSVNIVGVTTVEGIVQGQLPDSELVVSDLNVLTTRLDSSSDNTLYTVLPKPNISSLDLSNSSIIIRKSYTALEISDNELSTTISSGNNETFLPFDEERYTLIRSDGKFEVLTSDKFEFTDSFKNLKIYGLSSNDTGATLHTTLRKIKPTSKIKNKKRVNSIIVDKSTLSSSGTGSTTLNDGLIYGNYPYGTRVQDDIISLNFPNIIDVFGIYESIDSSNPSCPRMDLSSINSPSTKVTELIVGERIIGKTSGTVGLVAEKITDLQISFIAKSSSNFIENEVVLFEESNVEATITSLTSSSIDISPTFSFSNGQNDTFYNYGRITRKSGSISPSKKIKIYFSNGFYDSTDNGDISTVNSYSNFNYTKEIPVLSGVRNTDIIDIRPFVSNYNVLENSRSPFEFYGRIFGASGNSATNILASDETITISLSYYLGRLDRVFISSDGKIQVRNGIPSENYEPPLSVDGALEIATIKLPPYLYNVKDASIKFLEHKGYTMSDIRRLENRIKNLEYYTTLSLLETNTANLFIPDANGLNRFKSGFFVDNFRSLLSQEETIPVNNSIDTKNGEIRARHYTTSVDLVTGPVNNINSDIDFAFTQPEGINIKKTGDIITLDYTEVEWLKQTFATRTESITPYIISFWQATLELTPPSDTWMDTVRLDPKIINEGNYNEVVSFAVENLGFDPAKGFAPVVWNSWETDWIGEEILSTTVQREEVVNRERTSVGRNYQKHDSSTWRNDTFTTITNTIEDQIQEVITTGQESRSGTQLFITEEVSTTTQGDKVRSRDLVPYMRSRNVQIVAKRLKPLTRLYSFFDSVDVTKYCIPKLLDISVVSGVFEVGESVVGTMNRTGVNRDIPGVTPRITFRVARQDHREGPYNNPTSRFTQNPYNKKSIPSSYSSTSEILNIDTYSLSEQAQGEYGGWVAPGMVFVGQRSGAVAVLNDFKLISDLSSNWIGSFFIPNPNVSTNPRFETGTKVFTLINSENNDQNNATTIGEETYTASGILETIQEEIISVRNARIENKQLFEERAINSTTGPQIINSIISGQTTKNETQEVFVDPLAQSFLVEEDNGIFITSCDVFFQSKEDGDIPCIFQIRTMQIGIPTQKVLPFSEVVLTPDEINISDDGSIPTRFNFKSPVYLEGGGTSYAICLLSLSTKYQVYISRVGEEDIQTQTFISNQPYLGSLFKSQNGSTWDPSQWEDLKFTLYRAEFVNKGSVEFYNPPLSEGNGQVSTLLPDSLDFSSRKIRIGISSSLQDGSLTLGNTVLQSGTNASGNYIGNAGSANGTLNIINSGIGYTPSEGSLAYNNINLINITGSGKNATANITINNGVAVAATIQSSGFGYQVGDVLGIGTIGSTPIGRNARFSIVSIGNTNELILDNVQGDFIVSGVGNTVRYVNNSGITSDVNSNGVGNVQINNIEIVDDGLHIRVNHKNHGMYFEDNYATISNVQTDTIPTKLSVELDANSTEEIVVEDASQFSTFENVGVGTSNYGYLLIGDEVISYDQVSGNNIGISTRSISGFRRNYPVGTLIYKYELDGVSLKRINKTHHLEDSTIEDLISFDSYNIKLDMSSDGVDRSIGTTLPKLYINTSKSTGGTNIKATQNIPFEIISPMIQNVAVTGTSLDARLRTITGQSISGNEIPYQSSGFEPISLNKSNYLTTTRLVCSNVNESNNLTGLNLPGNRSLNLHLDLETVDTKVSPVIDSQRTSAIFVSNRVNSVIENYAEDGRVNTITEDPTAFQYISKEITLENPASSLKVLLTGYVNSYSDIRVFYAISDKNLFDPIFIPFPGYNNLDFRNRVIDFSESDGSSDLLVSKSQSLSLNSSSLDFSEYTFSVDQLPSFRSYRIKIIGTSTNQVYVPRLKDLRIIALA